MIIGIDPGIFGAAAIIGAGTKVISLARLPADAVDLAALLRAVDDPRGVVRLVVVETQTAMPRQGRTSIAGQMRGYGQILGVCAGLGIPVETIAPVVWKRRVGLISARSRSRSEKAWSLVHARTLPNFAACEPKRCNQALLVGMADAALMALAAVIVKPSYKPYHWRF